MNQKDLVDAFRKIGIRDGMTLECHASLRSFGHVEGGAQTVMEALIECVGKSGSLFMPALRLGPEQELTQEDKKLGIQVKIKILPREAKTTAMGIIADTFRDRADVVTAKGVFATSGWGLHAKEALSGGLDYAIHNGGKALLLGVDIYKLTAMHYVEEFLPQEIKELFAPNEEINRRYPPEEWMIETGEPPVRAWYTIQNMAYEKGLIETGHIGTCKYLFFDIWDVVGLYEAELKRAPLKLYGLE